MPALALVASVSTDVLYHRGFHAVGAVDELGAVFNDEIAGHIVAEGARDGELAACGDS